MRRIVFAAVVALLGARASAAEPSAGAWLEAKTIVSWNKAGLPLPKPPKIDGEPIATGRCAANHFSKAGT